jgi:hypothetical protein
MLITLHQQDMVGFTDNLPLKLYEGSSSYYDHFLERAVEAYTVNIQLPPKLLRSDSIDVIKTFISGVLSFNQYIFLNAKINTDNPGLNNHIILRVFLMKNHIDVATGNITLSKYYSNQSLNNHSESYNAKNDELIIRFVDTGDEIHPGITKYTLSKDTLLRDCILRIKSDYEEIYRITFKQAQSITTKDNNGDIFFRVTVVGKHKSFLENKGVDENGDLNIDMSIDSQLQPRMNNYKSSVNKYTTISAVIEAIQLTEENIDECYKFIGSTGNFLECGNGIDPGDGKFKITTFVEGIIPVAVGDYIVKFINSGLIFPYKPDRFKTDFKLFVDNDYVDLPLSEKIKKLCLNLNFTQVDDYFYMKRIEVNNEDSIVIKIIYRYRYNDVNYIVAHNWGNVEQKVIRNFITSDEDWNYIESHIYDLNGEFSRITYTHAHRHDVVRNMKNIDKMDPTIKTHWFDFTNYLKENNFKEYPTLPNDFVIRYVVNDFELKSVDIELCEDLKHFIIFENTYNFRTGVLNYRDNVQMIEIKNWTSLEYTIRDIQEHIFNRNGYFTVR